MMVETITAESEGFSPEDLAEAEQYGSLGPAYFAARRTAERFMAPFEAEHFKPLVEKFTTDFRDRLWSDVTDFLLSDTESNLQSTIWRYVDETVEALLTGKEWAMQRYPYADYSRGVDIRKAVAAHGSDELLTRRIADLEAELKKSREDIEWHRAR